VSAGIGFVWRDARLAEPTQNEASDGLTFLRKIMALHPIPVVICSSLAEEGARSTIKALEFGTVEIITKPRLGTRQFLEESHPLASVKW